MVGAVVVGGSCRRGRFAVQLLLMVMLIVMVMIRDLMS